MAASKTNHRNDRSRRAVTATAAVAVLLAAACGGGSGGSTGKESADAFVQRITTEFSRGQAGRLWNDLAPADQAIVSRARYTQCQGNQGFNLRSVKVLDHYSEPIEVDGASEHSEAVTVQVTSDTRVTTATMHAIDVGGRWRWILSAPDRADYRQGRCP